jgi:hypothetical protein
VIAEYEEAPVTSWPHYIKHLGRHGQIYITINSIHAQQSGWALRDSAIDKTSSTHPNTSLAEQACALEMRSQLCRASGARAISGNAIISVCARR